MITNEDYLSYLSEIDIMEKNMRDIYELTLSEVKDEKVKHVFESLYESEKQHVLLVDELRKILVGKIVKNP